MIALRTKTKTCIRLEQSSTGAAEENNISTNKIVEMNYSLDKKLPVEINHYGWISTIHNKNICCEMKCC